MHSDKLPRPIPDLLPAEPTGTTKPDAEPTSDMQAEAMQALGSAAVKAIVHADDQAPEYSEETLRAIIRDRQLLDRIADCDRTAFEKLWSLYEPKITAFCQNRISVKGPQGFYINDIKQEVAIAAWREFSAGHFEVLPGNSIGAWLLRVTRNKLVDTCRHLARIETPVDALPESHTEDKGFGVVDSTLSLHRYQALYQAWYLLDEQQREVLRCRVLEELSAEDSGKELGLKAGTVRVNQHRALKRLRELLAKSALNPDNAPDAA